MLDWISKKKEQKRREEREAELKRSLSEKVAQYQEQQDDPADDHTELFINGKKVRVAKEQIDLSDPDS
jgi:hypothetical protein